MSMCIKAKDAIWHAIGQIMSISGQDHYKTGVIKNTYVMVNWKKNGEEKFYYKTGELNKIKNWENGILQGNSLTYYKTGEKYIASNYKNNKLDDDYIVYKKDGSIIEKYIYKDGVKI